MQKLVFSFSSGTNEGNSSTNEHINLRLPETNPTLSHGAAMFTCLTGEKVHNIYVCDDILHCKDGSEEMTCEGTCIYD